MPCPRGSALFQLCQARLCLDAPACTLRRLPLTCGTAAPVLPARFYGQRPAGLAASAGFVGAGRAGVPRKGCHRARGRPVAASAAPPAAASARSAPSSFTSAPPTHCSTASTPGSSTSRARAPMRRRIWLARRPSECLADMGKEWAAPRITTCVHRFDPHPFGWRSGWPLLPVYPRGADGKGAGRYSPPGASRTQ